MIFYFTHLALFLVIFYRFKKKIFEMCINLHSNVAHQNQGIIVTAISLDIFIIIFQKVSDFDSLNSYISW